MSQRSATRRAVLRGGLGGLSVTVGLPLLDCLLDGNGIALASGAAMPVRFGTWHWGCGVNASRWIPQARGANYDLPPELAALASVRAKVNVLSGFRVLLDGNANFPHISGVVALRTGSAPTAPDDYARATLDVLVADAIGGSARFRSLDVAATGNPNHSYSRRSAALLNPAEVAPQALYARIFGLGFRDPARMAFQPDPKLLIRKSVLSAIADERHALMHGLGADDRQQVEQYFTAVRELEGQIDRQLQPPEPALACVKPSEPGTAAIGTEIETALANHRLLSRLLVLALACNQTRVFNIVFSDSLSSLRRAGESTSHHQLTHEEPVDAKLGYQPKATWFVEQSLGAWAEFVRDLEAVREGDVTLLDNCLVLAHSDTLYAKLHTLEGIPAMLAGRAGGRMKAGLHIDGKGDPITRIGLTSLQLMGLPVENWGTRSLATDKPIQDLLA
jgi:hypothetical protein